MRIVFILIFFLLTCSLIAQEHEHGDATSDTSAAPMSHAFSLNLPMNRNGSGTGWLPDASPMFGHGLHTEKWMFMFHNNIFLRYNHQDVTRKGSRGGEKADAPAWFMLMGQRKAGSRGLFRFNVMLSPDPFTVGGEGYPLLFQSGETYQGRRLVDRQHPHDLFSELSLAYTHMLTGNMDVTAYFGYPGEPALGPVAFMHRVSALNNPDAPLGHHWQDATHINYGVATVGIRLGKLKAEGSCFTGREPDENRYDLDPARFDSWSGRLSFNPGRQWSLQLSRAFLREPEVFEPGVNVHRTTASVIHHLPFAREDHYLSTALVWGENDGGHVEHSVLLEPALQLNKTALYGRYEFIQKSALELDLAQLNNGHELIFNIQAFTLGMNHTFLRKFGFNAALGGQASVFAADAALDNVYGRNPVSIEVYLRIFPDKMHMHAYQAKRTKEHKH